MTGRDPFDMLADSLAPRDVLAEVFEAVGYQPTARQSEFHAATEYDVLLGGSAGGGKTAALVADDLADAVRWPGIRIGAFRRTYDELSESLLKQLAAFDYAEALGARWNGTERELRFPNGSVIRYRYAESLQDATRRQGGEFQKLTLDERTLFSPDVVDMLQERLRSGSAAVPVLGVRSATNPGGAGHAQVKARFIDGTAHGRRIVTDEQGFTVRFIPARVSDNPHVDAGYVRRLQAIPDAARRAAMKDGDWDQFSGQYFTEWTRDRHVVPAFPIPSTWLRYAGIDWGFSAPWAVVWLAEDEDRRVWVYRERYAARVGERDQARRVVDAEADAGEQVVTRWADDAMWSGRGEVKSVADVYAENGCHLTQARKGERIIGWQRVHEYLADGPACRLHREQGWATCPKLHVLDGRAPNLVRTLPALPHDATKVEDVDTHAEDHAPDALRYILINLADPAGWVFDDPPAEQAARLLLATMVTGPREPGLPDFTVDRPPDPGAVIRSPFA